MELSVSQCSSSICPSVSSELEMERWSPLKYFQFVRCVCNLKHGNYVGKLRWTEEGNINLMVNVNNMVTFVSYILQPQTADTGESKCWSNLL